MFGWFKKKVQPQPIPGTVPNLVNKWKDRRLYTPDFYELERYDGHCVFVVDDLQEGMAKNYLLEGAVKLYEGFTQSNHVMFKHDLGRLSYPIPFEENPFKKLPMPERPIRGTVYRISPDKFLELDRDKMNTVQFFRKRVQIVVPYSRIWFKEKKDLAAFLNLQPENQETFEHRAKIKEGVLPQARTLNRYGMMRYWPWMYYGEVSYWKDLLNNHEHPPVTIYSDDGVIKEYYHFNINELKGYP